MKKNLAYAFLFVATVITISACSKSDNDSNNGNGNNVGQRNNVVDWANVSRDFNPDTDTYNLDIQDVQKVKMDLFSFTGDVQVQYSSQLAPEAATLQTFTVSKDSTYGIGSPQPRRDSDPTVLKVSNSGVYSCSIRVQNRNITALKGACYVKVILTLPANAKIEVYNLDALISSRFFATTNAALLDGLDRLRGRFRRSLKAGNAS